VKQTQLHSNTLVQVNSIMFRPAESFRLWRDRNQSRQGAEPIDQHEQETDTPSTTTTTTSTTTATTTPNVVEEDVEQPRSLNPSTERSASVETVDFHPSTDEDHEPQTPTTSSSQAQQSQQQQQQQSQDGITVSLANRPRLEEVGLISEDDQDSSDDDDDVGGIMSAMTSVVEDVEGGVFRTLRQQGETVTLTELEEERELARRRSSACVMLSLFILVRMWFEALLDGNFALFLLCSVLTSWALRWHRYNREREEELDRRIQEYWTARNNTTTTTAGDGSTTTTMTPEMPRSDLAMLSFQAQLALAIMESQRQVMQGGYGHPDGEHSTVGVSDDQKQTWKRTKYASSSSSSSKQVVEPEEDVTCSICLCDYEPGDNIVTLPCGHMYHEDCVSSWTSNHIRCPLCNYDLTAAAAVEDNNPTTTTTTNNNNNEEHSNANNPGTSSTSVEVNDTTTSRDEATEGHDDSIV